MLLSFETFYDLLNHDKREQFAHEVGRDYMGEVTKHFENFDRFLSNLLGRHRPYDTIKEVVNLDKTRVVFESARNTATILNSFLSYHCNDVEAVRFFMREVIGPLRSQTIEAIQSFIKNLKINFEYSKLPINQQWLVAKEIFSAINFQTVLLENASDLFSILKYLPNKYTLPFLKEILSSERVQSLVTTDKDLALLLSHLPLFSEDGFICLRDVLGFELIKKIPTDTETVVKLFSVCGINREYMLNGALPPQKMREVIKNIADLTAILNAYTDDYTKRFSLLKSLFSPAELQKLIDNVADAKLLLDCFGKDNIIPEMFTCELIAKLSAEVASVDCINDLVAVLNLDAFSPSEQPQYFLQALLSPEKIRSLTHTIDDLIKLSYCFGNCLSGVKSLPILYQNILGVELIRKIVNDFDKLIKIRDLLLEEIQFLFLKDIIGSKAVALLVNNDEQLTTLVLELPEEQRVMFVAEIKAFKSQTSLVGNSEQRFFKDIKDAPINSGLTPKGSIGMSPEK